MHRAANANLCSKDCSDGCATGAQLRPPPVQIATVSSDIHLSRAERLRDGKAVQRSALTREGRAGAAISRLHDVGHVHLPLPKHKDRRTEGHRVAAFGAARLGTMAEERRQRLGRHATD